MTQSWKIRGETIGGLSFYFTHKKCWENGKHLQFVVSLFVVGVLWSPLVWVLVGLFNRLGSRMVVEYCKEIRWASKRFHGWPSWKKSETVDASEIWGTPIYLATLPKTNSSHLKHCGWIRWVSFQDGLLAAGKIHETSHEMESFISSSQPVGRIFFHQASKTETVKTVDFGVQRVSFNHEDFSENCYFNTRQWKQSFTKSACHLWSSFTSSNLFSKVQPKQHLSMCRGIHALAWDVP